MTPPGRAGFRMTERMWQATILVLSLAVIIVSAWCLSHGITTIFMHLYYFPIVLLAYHYRWKGVGPATLLALAYLGLVLFFDTGQPDVIVGAFYRFLVFVGIAGVIAYLAEQLARALANQQRSTEIRERYLSLAPAIILMLDRNGAITLLNEKGCSILACTFDKVEGKSWVDTFIREDDREQVRSVFSNLIRGNLAPYSMLEGEVVTGAGTRRFIRWYNTVIRDAGGTITGTMSYGQDITEERLARDAMRKLQQFQESVITNANIWISVLAPDGTILIWNDAAERISGYKKAGVVGQKTIWKQLYPDRVYRHKITTEIQGIISRETYLENFETRIRCADGTAKTIVWNTRALRDTRGDITGYIAIGSDVTAQRSAELRAGESSRFLAAMIDTLPLPIFFKDTDGVYLGCNPPFEEYIGIKREDLVGKSVYDISPKDLADQYAAADRQIFDNPVPQRYETQVQYADGSRHDVIFYKAPFFNKDGTLGGLIGAFLDITERKRMEDALQESESFNRGLVENLPEYIAIYGQDGKILYVNPASAMALGYDAGSLVGTNVLNYIAEEYHGTVAAKIAARQAGDTSSYEIDLVSKNGSRHSVIVKATPIQYRTNPAILLLLVDITDRKREEDEIRLSNVILTTQQETSPDGILIVDDSGKIISFNNRFTEIWGIPPEILASGSDEPVLSFVADRVANTEEFLARVKYLYGHREEKSREEIQLKDGKVLERYSSPMLGEDNRYFGRVWYFHDITVRRNAEKILQESEEKYRAFFTTSRDCVFITTLDGSWVDFNDAAVELFGYESREDLLKIKIPQVYANASDREAHVRFIRDNGYSFEYPVDLKRKDGTIIHTLITTVARKDASGNILGFQGSIRDITERKAAQDRIEELLRIINTSPAVAFLWKAEENWPVETVSENISQFGYTREDFVSGRIQYSAIIHPEDLARVSGEVEYDSGHHIDDYTQEYRIFGKGGEVYWVADYTHIRRDPSGKITHYEGIVLDITERKRVEEALQKSEHRSAMLLQAIPDMMFIISREGVYRDLRVPDESDLAIPADKIIGTNVRDSGFGKESTDAILHHIALALETKELQLFEYDLTLPKGIREYEARLLALNADEVLGIVRDITDRKHAEEAVQATVKLNQLIDTMSVKESIGYTLDEAERLTNSKIGFFHLINPDEQTIQLVVWSTETKKHCFIPKEPEMHYPVDKAGVWVDALRYRKPVIHNDYASLPHKKGLPEGHVPVIRELVVPIFDETKIVAIVGVGNKATDYDEKDINVVTLLAKNAWTLIQRKRAEEDLQRSIERFRMVMDSIDALVYVVDMKTYELLFINKYGKDIWGGDIEGKVCWQTIQSGQAGPCPFCTNDRLVDEKGNPNGIYNWEFRNTVNGHWYDCRDSAIRWFDGRIVRLEIATDITGRKQIEEELRESRQLFADIISFLPDPTFVIDKDGTVLAWNRAIEKMSGVPAREMIGRGDYEYSLWQYGKKRPLLIDLVLHPDQDTGRMNYTDILWEGSTVTAQTVIIRPGSNRETPVSLVASPLINSQGMVTGAIESMRDITHLKETEAELARINQNLEQIVRDRTRALEDEVAQRIRAEKNVQAALDYTRSVIEANPDLMVVLDGEGNILDINAAGELLTGIPKVQLIGTPYFGYLVEDGTIYSAFAGLLEKGTIENFVRIRHTDGHVTPLSVHATVITGRDGGKVQIIVSAHDITRQKQDEEAIRASLDEKILLLREIHHRVKNNLQIIISLTNLQMRTLDDPRMKQVMAETQNRVRAMSLVHERLYQSENLSSINLADYTRFLANQLFSFYGTDHGNVALHADIGDIQLDINTAIPLGLILNELISNALKHAFPNGRRGTISISGHSDGGILTLVIEDDGMGLPPGFDWKNTESLGLRLVNSLVDQLGGTIERRAGTGTVFIITIPGKPK